MTVESIPESAPCQLKTGHCTRETGKPLAAPSVNGPGIAAKAVLPILNAVPETANHIQSPEAGLSLPSPTLTTSLPTVNPTTCGPGASDAIPPMTPSTMPEPESAAPALSVTIASPRSLSGKKRNKSADRSRELQRVLREDATQLPMYQIQLEHYKPFTDKVKIGIEVWGSSAKCDGGEYAVRAKQIAATCQMSGLNDPHATPDKRLAAATALWKGKEAFDRAFELQSGKDEWKQQFKKSLDEVGNFFGLGNKQAVKARMKAQRKEA